ncbi:hypothetical protein GCM10010468_75770 [Actinocorallia longicatena]|uniref:Tetratricopeptide repeat protein n=1 Tax=Actinocorallia longicatena TaxID=111803 RepID=A0ABP6QL96_9ACTN
MAGAGRQAERLEKSALEFPEERGEILLEAAGQWAPAGESERALAIHGDLLGSGSSEDAK